VALVGESGSGKSVTALVHPAPAGQHRRQPRGRITLDGTDVLTADADALHRLRGGVAGMVFQEPMTSLNPLHSIGRQVSEAITCTAPARRQRCATRSSAAWNLRACPTGRAPRRLPAPAFRRASASA
jgi:microcin C transport system ATP-binding protein